MKREDLTGRVFHRLKALRPLEESGKKSRWECECACGAIVNVQAASLKNGHCKSCGCRKSQLARTRAIQNFTKRFITINGTTRSLSEWAKVSGIRVTTLRMRIDQYGWSPKKAVLTPTPEMRKQP